MSMIDELKQMSRQRPYTAPNNQPKQGQNPKGPAQAAIDEVMNSVHDKNHRP